ncbi:P-loop NTPase fold protein [Chitinophagaceae bacterium MMS25-I14]
MNISIDKPQESFTIHLKQENNDRILFSGKFGTGKSYFLKKYFETRAKDYNLFWISPVNYVVGANQDIFEWIKIDVAKELLTKYPLDNDEEPYSDNLIIQTYLYNNVGSLFTKLLKQILNNKVKDVTGIDVAETFKKEFEEFKAFKDATEDGKDLNIEAIKKFINDSLESKGSIYEDNLITRILRAYIEQLKADSEKQNILVIDDLDRLDPEHIFRILNILSVHNDHFDSNKFGFDKVIVVCDLDNVESLYRHRYGEKADFEGYMEKFYTFEPFRYSLEDAIADYCMNDLSVGNILESDRITMALILKLLYYNGHFKIRNFKKINHVSCKDITLNSRSLKFDIPTSRILGNACFSTNIFEVDLSAYGIIKVIYLISLGLGGVEQLRKILRSMKKVLLDLSSDEFEHVFKSMRVICHVIEKMKSGKNEDVFYRFDGNNRHLDYPSYYVLGKSGEIYFKWQIPEIYSGGDYFEGAMFVNNHNNIPFQKNSISCYEFLQEILKISDFLVEKKVFFNTVYL